MPLERVQMQQNTDKSMFVTVYNFNMVTRAGRNGHVCQSNLFIDFKNNVGTYCSLCHNSHQTDTHTLPELNEIQIILTCHCSRYLQVCTEQELCSQMT